MTATACACHLSREVFALRDEVDALKQELHDLREQMATRDQPDVSRQPAVLMKPTLNRWYF